MTTGFDRPPTDLPGDRTSVWEYPHDRQDYPTLSTDRTVDIAVIGGGITGVSITSELLDRGYSVILIERDRLGAGASGSDPGVLTSLPTVRYDRITSVIGEDAALALARRSTSAIETVASKVELLDIDCGFERSSTVVYGDSPDTFDREVMAATDCGIEATHVTSVPPFDRASSGIRVDDQARLNPSAYLHALAESIDDHERGTIVEGTTVDEVSHGKPCRIEAVDASGVGEETISVTADHVVCATGYPIVDTARVFTRAIPVRTYHLALDIVGDPPVDTYIDADTPGHLVRPFRAGSNQRIIVGGKWHKTGQGGSTIDRYRRLEAWAHDRFRIRDITHRWSRQSYVSTDDLPLIGRGGIRSNRIIIATGFGRNDLAMRVAAGGVIADVIEGKTGRSNPFDPFRLPARSLVADALVENLDAMSQFATDWLDVLLGSGRTELDPGDGRIVRDGSRTLAISKDADGRTFVTAGVCPHQRCVLTWNDAECTWDCPCHGSRFEPDGELIEGPAREALAAYDLPENSD